MKVKHEFESAEQANISEILKEKRCQQTRLRWKHPSAEEKKRKLLLFRTPSMLPCPDQNTLSSDSREPTKAPGGSGCEVTMWALTNKKRSIGSTRMNGKGSRTGNWSLGLSGDPKKGGD